MVGAVTYVTALGIPITSALSDISTLQLSSASVQMLTTGCVGLMRGLSPFSLSSTKLDVVSEHVVMC